MHESEKWKGSRSVVSESLQPRGLQPTRLLCPWDSPGKNTGVRCHFLLQGIFLTQELNPGVPHCRQILYPLSHQGSSDHVTPLFKKIPQFITVLTSKSPTAACPCFFFFLIPLKTSGYGGNNLGFDFRRPRLSPVLEPPLSRCVILSSFLWASFIYLFIECLSCAFDMLASVWGFWMWRKHAWYLPSMSFQTGLSFLICTSIMLIFVSLDCCLELTEVMDMNMLCSV